jgi:hypothetical protein
LEEVLCEREQERTERLIHHCLVSPLGYAPPVEFQRAIYHRGADQSEVATIKLASLRETRTVH